MPEVSPVLEELADEGALPLPVDEDCEIVVPEPWPAGSWSALFELLMAGRLFPGGGRKLGVGEAKGLLCRAEESTSSSTPGRMPVCEGPAVDKLGAAFVRLDVAGSS